jgi:hypothetical protein
MKARFVIGYILLAFGLLSSIYMASEFIRLFFAPPIGNIIEGLRAGIAWAFYLACSILFIIPVLSSWYYLLSSCPYDIMHNCNCSYQLFYAL